MAREGIISRVCTFNIFARVDDRRSPWTSARNVRSNFISEGTQVAFYSEKSLNMKVVEIGVKKDLDSKLSISF